MAIYVQREGHCGMSQVLGNGLDGIPDSDGVCRICVAEVMKAGFRNADLCDNFLQVLQDRIVDQVLAGFIDVDQVVFILPLVTGGQLQCCLLFMYLLQNLHHIRRWLDGAGFIILGFNEFIDTRAASFPDLLQLAFDRDRSVDEIHTVPAQTDDLALAHAGEYIHKEQVAIGIIFDFRQKLPEVGTRDRADFLLFDPGQFAGVTGMSWIRKKPGCR